MFKSRPLVLIHLPIFFFVGAYLFSSMFQLSLTEIIAGMLMIYALSFISVVLGLLAKAMTLKARTYDSTDKEQEGHQNAYLTMTIVFFVIWLTILIASHFLAGSSLSAPLLVTGVYGYFFMKQIVGNTKVEEMMNVFEKGDAKELTESTN